MSRTRSTVVVTALVALVLLAGCGGGGKAKPPSYPTVFGSVGPGATISLRDAAGKTIVRLKTGMYRFRITDRSRTDDFHFVGPTVDLTTRVRGTGVSGWLLTMNPGTYRFFSDTHRQTLAGSFKVS